MKEEGWNRKKYSWSDLYGKIFEKYVIVNITFFSKSRIAITFEKISWNWVWLRKLEMITILSFFVQNERFWSRWIGNFPKFNSVSSKTKKMNCLVVKSKKSMKLIFHFFVFTKNILCSNIQLTNLFTNKFVSKRMINSLH